MINILSHNIEVVPLILKNNVEASIDTIPTNEFLSYEFLPLDSSKLFYNIDAIEQESVLSGFEGLLRPFVQQIEGVLFLAFVFLFVLGAIVFNKSGLSHFTTIRNIFSFDSQKNKTNNELVTSIDAWSKLFYIFQTYALYSILFFVFAAENYSLYFNNYDYLILFLQILAGLFLFVTSKLLFYSLMEGVFPKTKINTLTHSYLNIFYLAGVLGFLPIILFVFIPEVRLYVFLFLLVLFIIGRIAIIAQTYIFFVKARIGSSYFFVYLCGVEIMPYLLLYKAIILVS